METGGEIGGVETNNEPGGIEFVYFDLGNVLLAFDHCRASRAIARLCGAEPEKVHAQIFGCGIQERYERGEMTTDGFYQFCVREFGDCNRAELLRSAGDIFEPQDDVLELARQLTRRGRAIGILSNTCEIHWLWCLEQHPLLAEFDVKVLSYEAESMKPEPAIYQTAEKAAIAANGATPERLFFVDDRPENVHAAIQRGWDAIRFHDADSLGLEFKKRKLL